jgi:[CysO sulfur-carrier protein]-S-L-cysteine hydrolase
MLTFTPADYKLMLAYLEAAYPQEACGLLAGKAGRIERLYPVTNILHSRFHFRMDSTEQVEALLDMEKQGWQLLAIFHSHPDGPGEPSAEDVANAFYPEAIQVIVSFAQAGRSGTVPAGLPNQATMVRAFRIDHGRVTEVRWSVQP